MRLVYTILILLSTGTITWSQTGGSINYEKLLTSLKADIPNGQPRTIRDICSIIDQPKITRQARTLLKNHSFFTKKEINVLEASKADLLEFYYENAKSIKYSEVLNAFYITPIEQTEVSFELKPKTQSNLEPNSGQLRRLLTELDSKLEAKKYEKAADIIRKITSLKNNDAEICLNILRDGRIMYAPEHLQKPIYQSLVASLKDYADIEVVEIVIQMVEGGFLDEAFANDFLKTMTNNEPSLNDELTTPLEYYQFLVDSLSSLEEIRTFGYERLFKPRINFFQFPVDYYGKILALSDQHEWIKSNIIADLKNSNHPRAFFYIISDLYRNLKENPEYPTAHYLFVVESMTNVTVGVKNKKNKITFNPLEDKVALENYFMYWASHYQDFEWDENRELFTNKLETLAKTQNYERLFRRLNSRNDTVALEAFMQLSEGEPLEIKALARKYRQLLRNQNRSIPSIKYFYLEQLSQLTAYCRLNKINYKIRSSLAKKLKKLLRAETPLERFTIENEIIASIEIRDITALEYWACLKENEKGLAFSIGRILDWTYSKHWDEILNDRNQLRLFLKKSYLYENIGVSGLCNVYLNKFTPKKQLEQVQLEEVGKIESDEDILNQISILLAANIEEDNTNYSIDEFLEDPLVFNRRDIKVLPPPSESDIVTIVNIIKDEQEPEIIKKLFSYLWQHPQIEFIPTLFELVNDERVVTRRGDLSVTVADNIIPMVENVYNHSFEISPKKPFATVQWRALWESDGDNYKNWRQVFFEAKLDSLQYFESIKIDQLNELTESDFYSEKYKNSILSNLNKIKPIRNIRRLSIAPKLSVKEDLMHFEQFFFSYKELDDIPKLFDITAGNVELMMDFIERKSSSYEASEKGSLYNNLLRAAWLNRFVSQGKLKNATITNIQKSLETYLNESEFLSEFEEQATQLNIAQLQFMGKNIQDKIDATLALDIDNASKATILKNIIATIDYKEIGLVIDKSDAMVDVLGEKAYAFLAKDFGIPVFSFNTMKQQNQFIRNHSKMSQSDFYTHYLKDFGVDIFAKKDQLDFQKIYNILRFDIATPFVGEAGGKRDLYIYGIIKLLELRFNDRLGFHEKLNESQTFYSFSSTKRAKAWISYLEENSLIDIQTLLPPSFNSLREE